MGTGFHLTGGEHLTQPVFCIVPQVSTALWRSIRRWVIGTDWRGGIQLKVLDQAIDTSTPTGRLMFQVLGAVAEFEREMGSSAAGHQWRTEGPLGAISAGVGRATAMSRLRWWCVSMGKARAGGRSRQRLATARARSTGS